jgi:hypothetical protein
VSPLAVERVRTHEPLTHGDAPRCNAAIGIDVRALTLVRRPEAFPVTAPPNVCASDCQP